MNAKFKLSRLCITGKLDLNTPLDVILEVAAAHNIDYSSVETKKHLQILIDTINEEDVPEVDKTLNIDNYYDIAIFVNDSEEWTIGQLETAYKFLKSFKNCGRFLDLSPDFKYGLQTPQEIHNINSSVIYGACRYHGIETSLETTEDEMVERLREFLLSEDQIINSIMIKLNDFTREELLKFRGSLDPKIIKKKEIKKNLRSHVIEELRESEIEKPTDPKEDPENLEIEKPKELEKSKDPKDTKDPKNTEEPKFSQNVSYEDLKRTADTIVTYYPTKEAIDTFVVSTHLEAIVISMLYYNVDVSDDASPIQSLNAIKSGRYRERSIKFNRTFPASLYNSEFLDILLNDEGQENIEEMSINEKCELLQIISLSDTFHSGKLKPCLNSETPIDLLTVDELTDDECLSYGSQDYTVITYSELYDLFKNTNSLLSPIGRENLSNLSIKKLLRLCSIEKSSVKSKLKDIIKSLNNLNVNKGDNIIREILGDLREDSTGIQRESLDKFIQMLFELGLNMRSWDGAGVYPLERSVDLDPKIRERRVNESLYNIELYQQNFSLCEKILRLPLVKYTTRGWISSDQDNGLTIKDRLKIVKENESIFACIRMSSNWILSSIYKYSLELEIKPKFEIKRLRFLY